MQYVSHLQIEAVEQALGHDNAARGENAFEITPGLQHHFAVKRISRLYNFELCQ